MIFKMADAAQNYGQTAERAHQSMEMENNVKTMVLTRMAQITQ